MYTTTFLLKAYIKFNNVLLQIYSMTNKADYGFHLEPSPCSDRGKWGGGGSTKLFLTTYFKIKVDSTDKQLQ